MSNGVDLRDLWYDWLGLNTWLFKQINSLSDVPVYKQLMVLITNFGDKELLPYFLALIIGYAIISVFSSQGHGKHRFLVWFNIMLVMTGALVANHFSTTYLKNHFAYPRPYAALPAGEFIQLEARPASDANHSFPSGHAAMITILIATLWPILTENFRWAAIGLVVSVCWSRIALGVHFPMDVLSGFTIALLQVVIIRAILFKIYAMMNGLMHMLSRAR